MPKPKPPCITLPAWLKANLGPKCLAPLTGTDARALSAAVQLIDLYSISWNPDALDAFALTVRCMTASTRHLAYHSIAHVMDWGHRAELWARAGLAPVLNLQRCRFEH